MARRTFTDIDAGVLLRLGNRTEATSALRMQWINDAVLRIVNEYEHPEMQGIANETLALGNDDLTPAVTDLSWPIKVKDTTNNKVLEPDTLERIEVGTKRDGKPGRYYWFGGVFFLDVNVDASTNIRIWYYKDAPEFASGNSSLKRVYDVIIEMRAAQVGLVFFREFEKAILLDTEIQKFVAKQNLPVRQAKLDDYGGRLMVRVGK